MKIFEKISQRKQKKQIPPLPAWETIVEIMYDKQLEAYQDTLVQVMYSKDSTMRYLILKDERGWFAYELEVLNPFDEDEWKYICREEGDLPAYWQSCGNVGGKSLFANTEDLRKELKTTPQYKLYFE